MALFQHTITKKYISTLDKQVITNQYALYKKHFLNAKIQENIRNSNEEQYQGEFLIDLFVHVLGYTKNPNPDFNLTTELKNINDNRKADGAILFDNKIVAVIELKGTKVIHLKHIEEQAFSYKNNQRDCVYVITSNFQKLRFYIDNAIEFIEFDLFNLSETDFMMLYLCLSCESIKANLPKKIKQESAAQEEIVTKMLYRDYIDFKNDLFSNLRLHHPEHDALILFQKSQKLLDRFLFLFFAEDKGLLQPNSVRSILAMWKALHDWDEYRPLYEQYKRYFNFLNKGLSTLDVFSYNGGLFAEDTLLDSFTIDDDILFKHTQKMSAYDFDSEVDVNILGHIFENSLNEIEEITAELKGEKTDKTQSKRKKDGVFYTPKFITNYIIESTVGKLCKEKKTALNIHDEVYFTDKKRSKQTHEHLNKNLIAYRDWLKTLRILDPACGSGAFLNEALNFLLNEYAYVDNLQTKLEGYAMVFPNYSVSILEHNLFGVDINEESVDIAKLALWLRTAKKGIKLNNLNNNIKCGNSLLDDAKVAGDKAFDWRKEFSHIFEEGGFDVVVGNPPYVRADTDSPVFIAQRKAIEASGQYDTLYEKWDLMIPFYERSIKLLKDKGLHGFIVSNAIATSKYAYKLQKWLLENKNLLSIDYFENIEVFKGVGVVPIVTVIENTKPAFNITKNIRINKFEEITVINTSYLLTDADKEISVFKRDYTLSALKIATIPLGDICYISVGMVINADEKTEKGAFSKDDLIQTVQDKIHSKPFVEGKDVGFYKFKRVKYLEWNTPRVPNGIRRKTFKELYEGEKLMRGSLTPATFDNSGIICNHGVMVFKRFVDMQNVNSKSIDNSITKNNLLSREELNILSSQYHLKFILAIINSSYAFYALNNTRRHRLKNYFYPDDFRHFVIPVVSLEKQTFLVELVDKMLDLQNSLATEQTNFLTTLAEEKKVIPNKKLNTFYSLDFDAFKAELKKQQVKFAFGSDLNQWRKYFNETVITLKALEMEKLQTEMEINEAVFALYNLSEEEKLKILRA